MTTTTKAHDYYCRDCQAAITTTRNERSQVVWVALDGSRCERSLSVEHELGFVDPTVEIPADAELIPNDSGSVDWHVPATQVKAGDRYRMFGHGFVQRQVTETYSNEATGYVHIVSASAHDAKFPEQLVCLTNGTF